MIPFDVYPLYNITPIKANGVYVYDIDGKKYLDLYGGHAVISIGHSHPHYVERLCSQVREIGFYSNAIQNPLQSVLAKKLGELSQCESYQLFMCNSGAEANENALKLASFQTKKTRVIALKNSFHGRTSAAVASTDNPNIVAPINAQQKVFFLEIGDIQSLEKELSKGDVCAVIFETIQGVGGLNEGNTDFYQAIETLSHRHGAITIADEIQSGYGRTGDFFAFQKHGIRPDIISIAKGMGNGFPIGGILVSPSIHPKHGMLGTTFGGNHLACAAAISVLEIIEKEQLQSNVTTVSDYLTQAKLPKQIKQIKGRGLMIGFEFNFDVGNIRKDLIFKKNIFTGGSSNKNLLRILPPLNVEKRHIDYFLKSLNEILN